MNLTCFIVSVVGADGDGVGNRASRVLDDEIQRDVELDNLWHSKEECHSIGKTTGGDHEYGECPVNDNNITA